MNERIIGSGTPDEQLPGEAAGVVNLQNTAGSLATAVTDVSMNWLTDQYKLAFKALKDLGFDKGDGVPALNRVSNSVGEYADWLNQRRAAGHADELIIAPSIKVWGLMGSGRMPGLIPRFDERQGAGVKTFVWNPLSGIYLKTRSPS